MGAPVCRGSSHIPTSKEMLEMHFWPMTGLTFPLITLVPEQEIEGEILKSLNSVTIFLLSVFIA